MMKRGTFPGWPISVLVIAFSALLLTACGGDAATATPIPPTATPTSPPAAEATAPPRPRATPTPSPLAALIAQAGAEGGKILAIGGYYDTPAEQAEAMAAMETMFGIKFTYDFAPNPGGSQNTFTSQLIKEAEAGQIPSSDTLHGTMATMPTANRAGILVNAMWAKYLPSRINTRALGGADYALATSTRIGGIQYNTDLVPPDAVPQTMEDLLDPRWKGLLAATVYAAVWDRASIGVDGTWDAAKAERILGILTQMSDNGNLAGIVNCGQDERIIAGEFAMLVFNCGDNSTRRFKAEGAPLDFAYIPDVANVTNNYVGLVKGAQYPASATLMMLFTQTEKGQELSRKFDYTDSWAFPGNTMYDVVADIQASGEIPVIDLATYGPNYDAVQEVKSRMKKVIRGG